MRSVMKGELDVTRGFIEEMEFCLDCQACETACPAGVKYGILVESTRDYISRGRHDRWSTRILKKILLRDLFLRRGRLEFVSRLLRFYQRSGLDTFIRRTGLLRLFSKRLHEIQFLAPRVSKLPSSKILGSPGELRNNKKYKIGFLTGCIMDVAFANINVDTVELLLYHDCEVIIPPTQVCCGSLLAHNGDMESARDLARRNVEIFADLHLDALVMNSAGCGAFMKQYGDVLKDDQEYSKPASEIASKVKDISEFLLQIGLKLGDGSAGPFISKRVTYHDACHLVHSQKVSEQPRTLIKSVPIAEFVELPESTWCCGSAGIYNITHYDTATQLLDRKIQNIRKVRPDVIVTGNPGCLVQLQYGLEKEGMNIELLHLATFLRRACCA